MDILKEATKLIGRSELESDPRWRFALKTKPTMQKLFVVDFSKIQGIVDALYTRLTVLADTVGTPADKKLIPKIKELTDDSIDFFDNSFDNKKEAFDQVYSLITGYTAFSQPLIKKFVEDKLIIKWFKIFNKNSSI